MRQRTLADEGFGKYRKPAHREQFLEEHDRIIPQAELSDVIEPSYPKGKGADRPPIGVERMLRIHFPQHGFNLSDPAVKEALYDVRVMCRFVVIGLSRESAPDETTICKFRHLLEAHNLGKWYLGMEAHIGVDSNAKLIRSVVTTPANVHDSQVLPDLLHGDETRVWGDLAYTGQGEVIREHAPGAKDFTHGRSHRPRPSADADHAKDRTKSRVRAKVEHPFLVLKQIFGFTKVRYRGVYKKANRLFGACGLVNPYLARRVLLRPTQGSCA